LSTSQVQVALSRELLSPDLEPLESDFYKKAVKMIKEAQSSGDQVTAELLLQSLKLLLAVRVQKELQMLFKKGEVPAGIPEEERSIVDCIRRVFLLFEGSKAPEEDEQALLRGPESKAEAFSTGGEAAASRAREVVLVSFLKPYPKIVDHGASLGPFKRGDIALLSRKMAEELEKGGYVEIIST